METNECYEIKNVVSELVVAGKIEENETTVSVECRCLVGMEGWSCMGPELGNIGWRQDGGEMAVHMSVLLCLSCLMSTEGMHEHPRGEENCMGKTGEIWRACPHGEIDVDS